jgi:hypothetical protein
MERQWGVAQSNEIESTTILPTEAAFAALLPEIEAVSEDELVAMNLDVVGTVTLVLGVLPELRALRAQIVEELPRFDLERFDKLKQYALALNHTNALHRSTLPSKATMAELGDELFEIRDRLYADAMALANYRLVDGERLKECKTATGYRATATDVFTIVAVFKETWPKLEGKTPVTLAALAEAGIKALELLGLVGVREQGPVTTGEATLLRQKAFTLFSNAYDDARRAVAYLRAPFGDAEDITPSFYAARGGRRREANDEAPQTSNAPSEPPASGVELTDGIEMDNSAGLPVTKPFTN